MPERTISTSRREFLSASALGAASAALAAGPALARPTARAKTLKIGLIGAGGRGSGAVTDCLQADPDCKLTAMADLFADRLEGSYRSLKQQGGDRIAVEKSRMFVGWDAYKKVLDTDVDLVLLTAPPGMRPLHIEAALAAGKHVFAEKPVAVDTPGLMRVIRASEGLKKKNLSLLSGLCWRYDTGVRETVKRVLGGEIGDVVSILTRQTIGGLWERENPSGASDIEKQVRNWNKWTWLCGDHYLENHVHSLDMCEWVLGELSPRRAWGFGGREQFKPDSWGNTFDHHAVSYEYPNGVNVESYSGCQGGTAGLYETEVRGTKGTAKLLEHTVRTHDGKRWKFEGEKRSMYVNEQAEFLQAIRKEEPLYNGDYMNHSTLVALLGRWASYTGQIVTMEQAKNSKQVLGPSVYEFASYDAGPKAQPGVTKLA